MENTKKMIIMFWNNRNTELTLKIIPDLCAGCGRCMARCRRDALRMHYRADKATVWLAYPERCTGCGKCTRVCQMQALYLEKESGQVYGAFK